MTAVFKSDCFLLSQESDVICCYNNTISKLINVEAHNTEAKGIVQTIP